MVKRGAGFFAFIRFFYIDQRSIFVKFNKDGLLVYLFY